MFSTFIDYDYICIEQTNNKHMKCTQCKDGKMTINVTEYGKEPKAVEIDCIHCNGSGEIDQATAEAIEYEKNMWCKCDEHTGPRYYSDGEHPEISKHHYRCTTCDGVVQIG